MCLLKDNGRTAYEVPEQTADPARSPTERGCSPALKAADGSPARPVPVLSRYMAESYAAGLPASGSRSVNVVVPGSLFRVMVPPWARAREWATARPRPLPPRSRLRALSTR